MKNDYTIAYERELYQLKTNFALKGRKVLICEALNGKIFVEYKGLKLKCFKIHLKPFKKTLDEFESEKVVRKVRRSKTC